MSGIYYLTTIQGLESLAIDEVKSIGKQLAVSGLLPGHVRIVGDVEPRALLQLGIPEDVFFLLYESNDMTRSRSSLGKIFRAVAYGSRFDQALTIRHAISRKRPRRINYHVVAKKTGQHNFTRQDLAKAVDKAVAVRTNERWRRVDANADVEIWIEVVRTHCLVGMRLSDRTMRHRTYKVRQVVASLRPTVAHAMVRLTKPRDNDVFCDPMCGAGTILIERGEVGRYQLLLGGDKNPEAVAAARANIGPRYKPIQLQVWDAARLPVDSGAVSAIAVNPPFGRKIGTVEDVQELYPAFLREAERVLLIGGRLVVLTDKEKLLFRTLSDLSFIVQKSIPIRLLGHKAIICVAKRI